MEERTKIHVGLDVDKDSISVATAEPGRAPARLGSRRSMAAVLSNRSLAWRSFCRSDVWKWPGGESGLAASGNS